MLQTVASTNKGAEVLTIRDEYIKAFRWMLLARVLDEKFATLYRAGKIHGGVYTGKGQEALSVAVVTMGRRGGPSKSSERLHKLLVGASGGIGGAFGLVALGVELPISTTIMLRSIADIARSEGHDPRAVDTRLACLEVFALGGRSPADDAAESSYWAVRAALAKAISEAASYLAEKGILEKSAPAVVRLISSIASRFGVIVSEQVAAKAIPIVGAAGGSIINVLFMNHFQDMARGHFIVKRLERKYGSEVVQETYNQLAVPMSR